jgi:hypothetical protein
LTPGKLPAGKIAENTGDSRDGRSEKSPHVLNPFVKRTNITFVKQYQIRETKQHHSS